MIPKIVNLKTLPNFMLYVVFDDGKKVVYDMKDDINALPNYKDLVTINGLFEQVNVDQSRTCIFWNDYIDLSSDIIYEYGETSKL